MKTLTRRTSTTFSRSCSTSFSSRSDPLALPGGRLSRKDDHPWDFGLRIEDGWGEVWRRLLGREPQPYTLDLSSHTGVIVGLSEQSIRLSQRRLAYTAAQQGWKVVMVDPNSSASKATDFVEVIRQAGVGYTYVYTHDRTRATGSALAAARAKPDRVHARPPNSMPLLEDTLQSLLRELPSLLVTNGKSAPGAMHELTGFVYPTPVSSPVAVPYEDAGAVYLGFNVWSDPQEARRTAQALLADFLRFLAASRGQPVLLLLEHPAFLFDMRKISPLFALLEQRGGSLFLSSRSVADFGREASSILKNARTLIAHRCSTTLPFEPYVSLSWKGNHPFFRGSIRQFDTPECFVIHAGQVAHVRVHPVDIDWLNSESKFDAYLDSVFGPVESEDWEKELGEEEMTEARPSAPPVKRQAPKRRTRTEKRPKNTRSS